jgi:hypothetical protein
MMLARQAPAMEELIATISGFRFLCTRARAHAHAYAHAPPLSLDFLKAKLLIVQTRY